MSVPVMQVSLPLMSFTVPWDMEKFVMRLILFTINRFVPVSRIHWRLSVSAMKVIGSSLEGTGDDD